MENSKVDELPNSEPPKEGPLKDASLTDEPLKENPVEQAPPSDSSASERNAKSIFDAEIGEPLTTTTTPGDARDGSGKELGLNDESTPAEGGLGPAVAASVANSDAPGLPGWGTPPRLPRVTFDENADVDELSDEERPYSPSGNFVTLYTK